jgi:CheY-like chemotaxis protein
MPGKFRAIVIDDMDFCRELLADYLESRGYEVFCFPDVTSCQLFNNHNAICHGETPCADVLLLDNLMPQMKGIDFLELLQQSRCQMSIESRAIFSANWSAEDLGRAVHLGCQVFHKPYDFNLLDNWLTEQEQRVGADRVLADWNSLGKAHNLLNYP